MTDTTWHTTIAATDTVSGSLETLMANSAAARLVSIATYAVDSALDDSADVVLLDGTSADVDGELPSAATATAGSQYLIAATNVSNTVRIVPDGSDTINGSASAITLTTQWEWRRIVRISATGWLATS